MFRIKTYDDWCSEEFFYNKKENAAKKAIELYKDCIKEGGYKSIEQWNELFMGEKNAFENIKEAIKTGNYGDDFIFIEEIVTED